MSEQKHPVRGILAGIAGGLIASWVMNEFMAGPGQQLTKAAEAVEHSIKPEPPAAPAKKSRKRQPLDSTQDAQPDATMIAADAITAAVTGGQHLTWEQEEKGGPIVHYAFGALAGGLYGALAEYSPLVRSGFGTTFGSVLFTGADLLAVPALHLSKPATEYPASSYANPLGAHLVYGITTELVRRLIRHVL